jgi:predicted nucleic acid-binding protein
MKAFKVYLDNCVFNRPFDDQNQIRIKLETEAKFHIQALIKEDRLILIWSYILELENAHSPFVERRKAIEQWQKIAQVDIEETTTIINKAHELQKLGVKSKDALHVACAIEGKADYFVTTDDSLSKKTADLDVITVVNPLSFIDYLDGA